MLKISYHSQFKDKDGDIYDDYEEQIFYVTDQKEFELQNCPDSIAEVYADGQELNRIQQRFQNLPLAHHHCRWRGEMAQFIVLNF